MRLGIGVLDNEIMKYVPVNERGYRIGEGHPRAKLTDHDVELIRTLFEDGMRYKLIAEKFEVTHWIIGRICRYERRNQTIANFKLCKGD
jgi:DNA invertase Pin-like site-specific DNA recombinase